MNANNKTLRMDGLDNVMRSLHVSLNESLEIDKEIFKFSWRKILPIPFIFQKVNYHGYLLKGESILVDLQAIQMQLANLSDNVCDTIDPIRTFKDYTFIFCETQKALNEVCNILCKKSQDHNQVNYKTYNETVEKYKDLDIKRAEIGKRLNQVVTDFNMV